VPRSDLRQVFGCNVRRLREAKGRSQENLAHCAGVNRSYLSSFENGVNHVGLEIIEKIANVLEVEPADLLRRQV
jgi:transcriptional regulator with XRE-family HTH domain